MASSFDRRSSSTRRSRRLRLGTDGAGRASRNIGEVDKVSARALIGASFGSLAVSGKKPQRMGPRRFSPLKEMMVSTIWLGATL